MRLRTWLLIACVLAAPALAWSQPSAAEDAGTIGFDPIRCWWRTSAGAVRIGENFSLVMTCAILDNEGAQVVVDDARLAPAVMQLAPFEVVGGNRSADLRERQRRFFQYDYILRAIGPDLIGQDVPIPDFSVGYRIISRIPGNSAQEGRELAYRLPPQSVRVVSTVPESTFDIRDAPNVIFGSIEALRSRAGMMDLLALIMAGLGSVMVVLAAAGLFTGRRARVSTGPRTLAPHTVAGYASKELAEVQQEAATMGWDAGRLDRALSAARIAGACALGRVVNQQPATETSEAGAGRLVFKRKALPGGSMTLSGSVTAEDLSRAANALPLTASPAQRVRLEQLSEAIATLTAAYYARTGTPDREALDAAVTAARAQAKSIRADRLKPGALMNSWRARSQGSGTDRAA